ncbi:TlpA family protein disulfide reductase [Gynurincola endophyticus]|uniref:TlpA family protein disulfide reductase n=1 Tax=Gynurincola endophyticus TaxID=2479004 RepID=UPI000F8F0D10|nr:TlpA disulfide reductase family protein [Gynurincola endophyticus]
MIYLLRTGSFLLIASILPFLSSGQQLMFKPDLPEAGKTLTLEYIARNDYHKKELYAYLYVITDEKPVLVDGFLSRKGKKYKGKVKLPANAKAIYTYVYQHDYFDNNFQKGYTAITRGNESSGRILLLAEKILNERNWSPNTYFPDLDTELKKYQELYQQNWQVNEWLAAYDIRNYFDKTYSIDERADFLKTFITQENLTPMQADALKKRFNYFQERSYDQYLDSISGQKPTTASGTEIQLKRSVSQAYPAYKKAQQFRHFYDTIRNKSLQEDLINELSGLVIQEYLKEEKIDSALQWLQSVNTLKNNSLYGPLVVMAYTTLHQNNESQLTQLNRYIQSTNKITLNRFPYENIVNYQYRQKALDDFSLFLDALKNIQLNKKEKATEQFSRLLANKTIDFSLFSDIYLDLLTEQHKTAAIEDLWKASYYRNQPDPKMDTLVRQYTKEGKTSFSDYEEARRKILAELLEQEAQLITHSLSKVKAPAFDLVDIDGKKVSLESLKGKKLMIDFWATWCTFCKMSFPELKKLQEYFEANDPTVKFVFIQTMERGNLNKMVESGKKYLKENELPFYHVIDDHSDMYSSKFYLNSIPAKIFIDSEGNFVYKSIGFKAGYEKNLAEMKAIFNAMD